MEKRYDAIAVPLIAARVVLGWLMFYAGLTKVLAPGWNAAGFLNGAKTFSGFYAWLATPGLLGIVNFLNAWGLTLLEFRSFSGSSSGGRPGPAWS